MTHEQTLAELTKKIAETVPDLGVHSWTEEFGVHTVCAWCKLKATTTNLDTQCGTSRPITLEDFVLTLQKHFKDMGWTQTDDKELMKLSLFTYDASILQALGKWRMGKPLSEQSPETISFLHSLLHGE